MPSLLTTNRISSFLCFSIRADLIRKSTALRSQPKGASCSPRLPEVSCSYSTDAKDELAPEMTALAQPMGVRSLGQPIELDLGRANSACPIELDNTFERSTTASNRRSQRRDIGAFRPWRLRARSNEGRSTAGLEHRKGSLRHVASDRVEDCVAVGNHLREITSIVIDNFIRPERSHIGMVRRTRSRDHAGTNMPGKLDGKAGNAPRATLDQDGLAALKFQRILDRTKGREAGEGERGSIVMR